MAYYKFSINNGGISLKTKLLLALGFVIGLLLLSLFAFGFFIIALVGGVVFYIINLFQSRKREFPSTSIQTQRYRSQPKRDDDIIDI